MRILPVCIAAATLAATGCGGGSVSVDPSEWPVQWCNVKVGDTPERAIELMGKPTSDNRGGSGSMQWNSRDWQFNLFLDAGDRVRQLDINTYGLTDEQLAAFRCGTTRTADDPGGFEREAENARIMDDTLNP